MHANFSENFYSKDQKNAQYAQINTVTLLTDVQPTDGHILRATNLTESLDEHTMFVLRKKRQFKQPKFFKSKLTYSVIRLNKNNFNYQQRPQFSQSRLNSMNNDLKQINKDLNKVQMNKDPH